MFPGVERVVGWLRAGYPQGVPEGDYIPLVAVLKRRLGADEVHELGLWLADSGMLPANHIDVGTGYVGITDELPSVEELDRVQRRLHDAGWHVDEPPASRRLPGGTGRP